MNSKHYLEALGRIWFDLDLVWHLEPKTLPPCSLNFTVDSGNPRFSEFREGKLYSRTLDNKFLLSLHSHEHYIAFILIYIYMVISRKRRRGWGRREDFTTTSGTSSRELFLLWHLRIRAWLTYKRRQASVHLPPPCDLKIFFTCLMH